MASHKIFFSAGEISGDDRGADLIKHLKRLGDFEFYGLGGKKMMEAGLQSLSADVSTWNTMGFWESITRFLFRKLRLLRKSAEFIKKNQITIVILIDNQGFNIPLGKKAKQAGAKVIYYVPPAVSIWGRWNAPKIPVVADYLIPLLKEDEEIYRQYTDRVFYAGNPIVDRVAEFRMPTDFYERFQLDPRRPVVSIFPGSRYQEIETLLPVMLKTAKLLIEQEGQQVVLPVSHPHFAPFIHKHIKRQKLDGKIVVLEGMAYAAMNAASVNIMASGTATLESALFGKPPVICYRISSISFHIAKKLVPKQMIGLPNILLDNKVFPELLQKDFNVENLVEWVKYFQNLPEREQAELNKHYAKLKEMMGQPSVVERVARHVMEIL